MIKRFKIFDFRCIKPQKNRQSYYLQTLNLKSLNLNDIVRSVGTGENPCLIRVFAIANPHHPHSLIDNLCEKIINHN